jgi:tetraacyldisaccharide 4'-kinase
MTQPVPARLASPAPPRSPWQLLYGAAHRWRRSRWRRRARRLPRPVVSVGNLHWGGGGKTPLTAAVAAHLRDAGHRVCILSRGYGGRGRGVRVVSAGDGPRLGPADAGDEPVLLAEELPGVAVVVGPERWQAGREALQRLAPAPQVFVLDDGFSHVMLARDLDLLAFPAADPFAGGRLLPAGRLREPLAAARWADAALLTGLDDADPAAGAALAAALRPHGFTGRGFACALEVSPPRLGDGTRLPATTPVLLVSAIARPGTFTDAAEGAGLQVAGSVVFPDHHAYPPASLQRIRRAAREAAAAVVLTTAKDLVKLGGLLCAPDDPLLAVLPVAARPETAFWSWLDDRLGDAFAGIPREHSP